METSKWIDTTIHQNIIPEKLEGQCMDDVWGEETKLTVVNEAISILIFRNIIERLSLKIIPNKNNLTTHYIEYNINDTYEITKHNDNCDLTVIVYLKKDSTMKDTFYIGNKKCRKEKWDIDKDSYAVIAFNGNDEHWGRLEGYGKREIIAFHYYFDNN